MDVETILNQIRERVVSEENAHVSGTSVSTTTSSSDGSGSLSNQTEVLARVSEYLTVTGRAWNRLPPIFTNRRGPLGRIELWIKNTCKPLTRWFTWEQVNFNRVVHDALSDVTRILMAEAQELAALRAQLTNEMRREFLALRSDFNGQAAELRAVNSNHAEYEARLKETDAALARISNMLGEFADETRTGRSQLAGKIDELAAALREEQRVCFRQLSLEASEAAVLEDRGRRALEARLEKLEKSARNR